MPILNELYWLLIRCYIQYKILLHTYKAVDDASHILTLTKFHFTCGTQGKMMTMMMIDVLQPLSCTW